MPSVGASLGGMGETDSEPFNHRARARLALCQAARQLAEQAGALVPTTGDGHRQPGAWVQEAAQLAEGAREVLERAVIVERERGASWEDIGAALKTSRQAAHERFSEAEREWTAALARPYDRVLDPGNDEYPVSGHLPRPAAPGT